MVLQLSSSEFKNSPEILSKTNFKQMHLRLDKEGFFIKAIKDKSLTKHGIQALPLNKGTFLKDIRKSYQLWLMLLLPLLYIILFKYVPMYGIQLAFKRFIGSKGIWGSPWVGLANIKRFTDSYFFPRVMKNTIGINLYQLAAGFPLPIILAIALNSTRSTVYRKTVQLSTYLPHFISTVVMVGMLMQFLSPRNGILAKIVTMLGGAPVNYIGVPAYFKSIYVWSGIWQNTGWGTIVYLAALAAIDSTLHEAAIVDGANRFQRIIHIDIPGILPTAIILLILRTGRMMGVGFEKVYLLQNNLNTPTSEVISTYVYKVGLGGEGVADFSFATAIGLFNSIISIALLSTVNQISKKVTENSLW